MDSVAKSHIEKQAAIYDRRNYPLLLVNQFLSAFGDNFILTLILGPLMMRLAKGEITDQAQSIANIYYTSLLFIPYIVLAPLTGYLNDRFSKSRWLLGGNLVRLAGAGLVAQGWPAAGYLIVGIGAAVYSPAKYGILPEIVRPERLVKANGMLEMLTVVAILAGNVGGAKAFSLFSLRNCYLIVIGIYGVALVTNFLMSRTPSYREVRLRGSTREFFLNLGWLFSQPRLARILAGTALFWICGAILKMNFQPWGQQALRLPDMVHVSFLGLWLMTGLMLGNVLAGQLYAVGDLHATRRYAWLLAGGVAILGCIAGLMKMGFAYPNTLADAVLILTGLFAGLLLIPLNAALQAESHKDKLGKTIATQNGFENLAMFTGGVIAYIDVKVGFNPSELFFALAAFVAIVAIWLKVPGKSAGQDESLG
jgi:MFS transporter, LPLT family, lysophospholipid transporter